MSSWANHAVRSGFSPGQGLSETSIKEKLVANREAVTCPSAISGCVRASTSRISSGWRMRMPSTASAFLAREALWAVRALDVKSAVERLPLFDQASHFDLQVEPQAKLPEMLPGEQVVEDYRYLSLSLKAHPLSFLRDELRGIGITRSVDLLRCRTAAG